MQVERATVALDPRAAKFEVERGFSGYPVTGFAFNSNGGEPLGNLKLKLVQIGGVWKLPHPSYFASLTPPRTALSPEDFIFVKPDGSEDNARRAEAFNLLFDDQIAPVNSQIANYVQNPAATGGFKLDLNKFLTSTERLRIVWVRI